MKLPIVIASALGVGFAASAFLNVVQSQNAAQDRKLLQGTITDLRYQVNQDKLAMSGSSPSPSPAASPSASPVATPAASPSASPTPAPAAPAAAPNTTTVKISGNVHQGPSTSSTVLLAYTKLPVGTTVTLGSNASNGYQQITVSGITGYILAKDLN